MDDAFSAFVPMEPPGQGSGSETATQKDPKVLEEQRFISQTCDVEASKISKMDLDYASHAAGAKILDSSPGMISPSHILKGDPSAYMLAPCTKTSTSFVIGLAEVISLEKIGFISLEFFASQFRHIQILGSSTFPTDRWRILGEVELALSKTHQIFDLEPRCREQENGCWVRFLKIRILSQYNMDNSIYCALTNIQVFGSTVLKELDKKFELEDIEEANQNVPAPIVSDLLSDGLDMHILSNIGGMTGDPEIYLKRQQVDVEGWLQRARWKDPSVNLQGQQQQRGDNNVGGVNATLVGAGSRNRTVSSVSFMIRIINIEIIDFFI